jgi:hypothetical protein
MTSTVSAEMEDVVRRNMQLLGIPDTPTQPQIDCRCTISAQKVQNPNVSNAPSLPINAPALVPLALPPQPAPSAPSQPKMLASQFVPGLKTIPPTLELHQGLPGNAPFILPAGITPDLVVSTQKFAAEEAYDQYITEQNRKSIVAEEAAKAAKIKAEQEAVALAAKAATAVQSAQGSSPVAVAVAVSPSSTIAAAPPGASQPPPSTVALSVPPASVAAMPLTTAPVRVAASITEKFGSYNNKSKQVKDFTSPFNKETILLFLFVAFVVYILKQGNV